MSHQIIDIGANLAHDSFDDDRDEVLARAAAVGVRTLIITGSSDDSNTAALELAARHDELYSTAGVHPHHAADYSDASDAIIRRCIASPQCVAVGECALDRHHALERAARVCPEPNATSWTIRKLPSPVPGLPGYAGHL